jgi:protein TonB
MDFSRRQADPRRHLPGIAFVILLHVFIVYALVTGLAKKVVDVVRAPIEVKVIEEVKKPAPPPQIVVPPPPRMEAPPPPYIPPPEVLIQAPPPVQPPITVAAPPPPPPAPVVIAPLPPPVVVAPAPPAPPPGPINVRTVCTRMPQPELPGVNVTGTISMVAKMTITGGHVTQVEVSQISGTRDRRAQRLLAAAVEDAVRRYACSGDAVAVQEFVFNIN